MSNDLSLSGAPPAAAPPPRAVVPMPEFSARQIALVHRTVAKDATPDELNFFIEVCRHRGLDPFRRQIYCLIYNKSDAARRQMVLITSIDGQRVLASRCGNYRAASEPAEFVTDEALKSPANPAGLALARVRLWQFTHGSWWPVIGEARWSEFAPIRLEPEGGWDWQDSGELWADSGKPKKRRVARGELQPVLDDSGQWPKMPFHMLAKCATMQALRAGWPDEFGGLYDEAETDRQRVLDMDASDLIEQQQEEDRLARVKAGRRIAVTWGDRWGIEFVDYGQFADRVAEWLQEPARTAEEIGAFMSANREGLREYWGYSPSDGLELKKLMEAAEERLAKQESKA